MRFVWLKDTDPETQKCYALREEVFVKEQGFAEEFDEIDRTADHLLVYEGEAPVATARVFPDENGYHVGRICVVKEKRGTGLGRQLLNEAERFCREQGADRLVLGSQVRAEAFYESCGYKRYGQEYMEEFCPHVMMVKLL